MTLDLYFRKSVQSICFWQARGCKSFSEMHVFNWKRLGRDLQFIFYKRLVPLTSIFIVVSKGRQIWTGRWPERDRQTSIETEMDRVGQRKGWADREG